MFFLTNLLLVVGLIAKVLFNLNSMDGRVDGPIRETLASTEFEQLVRNYPGNTIRIPVSLRHAVERNSGTTSSADQVTLELSKGVLLKLIVDTRNGIFLDLGITLPDAHKLMAALMMPPKATPQTK